MQIFAPIIKIIKMGSDNVKKKIEEFNKQTVKNHNILKKESVNSYYNEFLGYNLNVNSLSQSELDYYFKQVLDNNPAFNNYYQNIKYLYKTNN